MATGCNGLDVKSIRLEIGRIDPRLGQQPIARLGEGMDSIAFSVGRILVFRFPKHAEAAAGLRREVALLPLLAPGLSLEIPRFAYVSEHSISGFPFVGYRIILGDPLHPRLYHRLPGTTRDRVHRDLGAFLSALHAFPVLQALDCGIEHHGGRAGYLGDFQRARDDVLPRLGNVVRRSVESRLNAFLEDDVNFDYAPTLLHADFWPDHILFSRPVNRLIGIIDFGDVALGDPDYDLAFLAQRLGPGFILDLLRYYPHPDPARLAEKVRCFAILNTIEDVFLGIERGDRRLIDSALADLTKHGESESQ